MREEYTLDWYSLKYFLLVFITIDVQFTLSDIQVSSAKGCLTYVRHIVHTFLDLQLMFVVIVSYAERL